MALDIAQLLSNLKTTQETTKLEAKTARESSDSSRSVMESICSFANEPNLGGGVILLGVREVENDGCKDFIIEGVDNPDKLQTDIATKAASMFNIPIRPTFTTQQVDGKNVIAIEVDELSASAKPLYFMKQGLPKGAFRRVSSSDIRCTGVDLAEFYSTDTYDSTIIADTSIDDISEEALNRYRQYRKKVNPDAEELTFSDIDLLYSLGCMHRRDNGTWCLTMAGLIVFGKPAALRRVTPMVRVDYITVPTNEWIDNPDNRFDTIDLRAPGIELVTRVVNFIMESLPKTFQLTEHSIQAKGVPPLPQRVVREAVVNALIHRSYRDNTPIQILRYPNRIEIRNPGYSLKPDDEIGTPGSVNRNPFIAAIFHETNLAETKGSGFRTMCRLMKGANMLPPIFDSNRDKNCFTLRLMLHNLLSGDDATWLQTFSDFSLSDAQKLALILLREIQAIDNFSYRQLNGVSATQASRDLKRLCDSGLIYPKGSGKSTYYLPSDHFKKLCQLYAPQTSFNDKSMVGNDKSMVGNDTSMVGNDKSMVGNDKSMVGNDKSMVGNRSAFSTPAEDLLDTFPKSLRDRIKALKGRSNRAEISEVILEMSSIRPFSASEIALGLGRNEKYIKNTYLKPLLQNGELTYTIPDMPRHPKQKYKKKNSN